jgi:hypothetical protein
MTRDSVVLKRPLEFFGQDTGLPPRLIPSTWNQSSGDPGLICPYDNRECFKITKTPPVQVIGCCVAGLPNPGARGLYESVIICPKRFYEKNIIFKDINSYLLSPLAGANKITRLRAFSELGTPAPHNRQIDWTLVGFGPNDELINYVAIEIQATATGSTGPIVPARDAYFGYDEGGFKDSYNYGTNITMSTKTILEQVLHKVPLFSAWNRKLVLVIQDNFLRHLRKQYNFQKFRPLDLSDDFVIFSYRLNKEEYGYSIILNEVISASKEIVATCILPNPSVMSEIKSYEAQFIEKFSNRGSQHIGLT